MVVVFGVVVRILLLLILKHIQVRALSSEAVGNETMAVVVLIVEFH